MSSRPRSFLLTVATLFVLGTTHRPAKAEDLSSAIYADVKEVLEELIREEVGRSTATFIRTRPDVGVALAFYFRDAVERIESNYWGALPTALRRGALDMVTDAVLWSLTRPAEVQENGAGEGGPALAPAAAAQGGADSSFSLEKFLKERSTELRSLKSAERRLLLDIKCPFGDSRDNVDDETKKLGLFCAVVRGIKAQISGREKEVVFFVQEVLTELFILHAMENNVYESNDLRALFRTWAQNPKDTLATLRKAFASNLARSLGGDGDPCKDDNSTACILMSSGSLPAWGISLKRRSGPKGAQDISEPLATGSITELLGDLARLGNVSDRLEDAAAELLETCENPICKTDGQELIVEVFSDDVRLGTLGAKIKMSPQRSLELTDRSRLDELEGQLNQLRAEVATAIPFDSSAGASEVAAVVRAASVAQQLLAMYWRTEGILSNASPDAVSAMTWIDIVDQAFQLIAAKAKGDKDVVEQVRTALSSASRSPRLLELLRAGSLEDYRALVTTVLNVAIPEPSLEGCADEDPASHKTLIRKPDEETSYRELYENSCGAEDGESSSQQENGTPSAPGGSVPIYSCAKPPPSTDQRDEKLHVSTCGVRKRDIALKRFIVQFAAYALEFSAKEGASEVAREAFRAAAKDLVRAQLGLSEGMPAPEEWDKVWRIFATGFYTPDVSLRVAWSPSYSNQIGPDGIRYYASLDLGFKTRLPITRNIGLQLTTVDLLAPLVELAYRERGQYDSTGLIALDLVRPRLNLLAGVPEFSPRLVASAGMGLRFITVDVKAGSTEAAPMFSYRAGAWPEFNAGLSLLF